MTDGSRVLVAMGAHAYATFAPEDVRLVPLGPG
jgi:hypothetical protein